MTDNQIQRSNLTGFQQNFTNPNQDNFGSSKPISGGPMHGPHARRSGSSKPKKKERNQQPIKIIKNINNNNYIFNNPQIEIKNP